MKKFLLGLFAISAISFSTIQPTIAQSAWHSQVSGKIAAEQRYPRVAQMRSQQGTAKLEVAIGKGGELVSARLISSTGSRALDQEALAMAHRVKSFPRPPAGPQKVVVTIVWRM